VVYNKYAYSDLVTRMNTLDAYLACASDATTHDSCNAKRPQVAYLEAQVIVALLYIYLYMFYIYVTMTSFYAAQGVTSMAVLQKCRSNFQQKIWDEAAYVLYDPEDSNKLLYGVTSIPKDVAKIQKQTANLEEVICLLDHHKQSIENKGCTAEYLRKTITNLQTDFFWMYDSSTMASPVPSQYVDGCIVFSGDFN
jgi:hypothetical protein